MKNYQFFIILSFLSLFIAELSKYLLDINSLLYESLSHQFARELIDEAFGSIRRWQLIGYVLIPFLLFLKSHLIAGVLGIGTFLFDKDVSHKKLWKIALIGEFIFLIPALLKLLWFYYFKTDYSLFDLETFYSLSLLNLFDIEQLPPWFLYPLQTINLFELLFIVTLSFLLDRTIGDRSYSGIKIVTGSYLPALVIWVAMVMFFIINQA